MKLPALKNAAPASLIDGQSIEDLIRNSTQNLQRMAAASGGSGDGPVYLKFDGTTGVWKLNREKVEPEDIGRIVAPYYGLFEGVIEWAAGQALQKIKRQMLGVHYDEPMSERLLPNPLSPNAYKKEIDGPTYTIGFVGYMLDDGATVGFEHSSGGSKKAFSALATTVTQAFAAFGEIVHPVIELGVDSYENSYGRTVFNPKFNVVGYVTDKRAKEVNVITDADIVTRPTATKAKQRRATTEAPAI